MGGKAASAPALPFLSSAPAKPGECRRTGNVFFLNLNIVSFLDKTPNLS